MTLLQELLAEASAASAAQLVYHRDYLRTRNKKYRKYHPRKTVVKEASVASSAQLVYHRDYLRTRNKKYRKYHPRKTTTVKS